MININRLEFTFRGGVASVEYFSSLEVYKFCCAIRRCRREHISAWTPSYTVDHLRSNTRLSFVNKLKKITAVNVTKSFDNLSFSLVKYFGLAIPATCCQQISNALTNINPVGVSFLEQKNQFQIRNVSEGNEGATK